MTVLIFANGDLNSRSWVRPYLTQAAAIIAANGGTRHLWRLNRPPDLVIGDLDSLPRDIRDWLEDGSVRVEESPAAKDETDLELALLHAARTYDDPILVIGAFGGRLDQTLANILLLVHPELIERHIELVTQYERAWLASGTVQIEGQVGDTVSLIPLGGDVHIRSTHGLRWPLQDEDLVFGPARGVSNELIASVATVSVASGYLLCIHTRRAWQR